MLSCIQYGCACLQAESESAKQSSQAALVIADLALPTAIASQPETGGVNMQKLQHEERTAAKLRGFGICLLSSGLCTGTARGGLIAKLDPSRFANLGCGLVPAVADRGEQSLEGAHTPPKPSRRVNDLSSSMAVCACMHTYMHAYMHTLHFIPHAYIGVHAYAHVHLRILDMYTHALLDTYEYIYV